MTNNENFKDVAIASLVAFTIGLSLLVLTDNTEAYTAKKEPLIMVEDYSSSIKWAGGNQAVTIYAKQVEEMKTRGYDNTRILDLLAIKSMECNSYTSCVGHHGLDIGPFQINKVHKDEFVTSWRLHNSNQFAGLFLYQLTYANKLIQSYEDRFCGEHIYKQIGRTFTNEKRFKCVAVSYNGHPRYKATYAKIGWEKRKMISNYLFTNNYLTIN